MTCIIGLETPEGVIMGGDSAGVAGLDVNVRTDPKVFANGVYLFGMCGSFRMGQLLHHSFVNPEHPAGMDDYQFMCTRFIDAVRQCFKDGGYLRQWAGSDVGGTFLTAYNGKLYRIDSDFQVGMAGEGFASVGCGESYAHGSLFSTQDLHSAERRVEIALRAAEHFSGGVLPPFIIMSAERGMISKAPKRKTNKTLAPKGKKKPVKKKPAKKGTR